MMDHYEMVEKLRQKANVSYEEAKAALEATDWDILDALVLLENQGKVKNEEAGKEYSTQRPAQAEPQKNTPPEWKENLRRCFQYLVKLFRKGNANNFVAYSKKGKTELDMPITVLVLLLICLWPFSLVALVGGLLCGCRYCFRGPNVSEKVNDAMDKAADAVQGKDEKKDQE